MSMPRAKLTKLILDELAAVAAGAQEAQGTAVLKSRKTAAISKRSALTTPELGHTHLLYGIDDSMAGTTSHESTCVEGQNRDCYTGHCHPWVRSEDGSITVGEAMGHSHAVGAMSAPLAKNNKSTQAPPVAHGEPTHEEIMSNTPDLAKQLADVTKRNERLERVAKLSGAHKSHYDTLSADDAEAFLAKSTADRDAIVTELSKRREETEKVVYVSKSTGDVYKAKDDPRLVDMAKRMDEQAVSIEKAKIRKQATEVLGGMPGADDAHDLIVGSLLKSGAKQEEIDAAIAVLSGMKATSTIGKSAPGANPGSDPASGGADAALKALEKGLVKFAKEKNISNVWTDGLAAFRQTDEGAALKRAYDESLNG